MTMRQEFKFIPQLLNVDKKSGQPKKKKNKITLVFDEEKRKEFLTGFRKRRLERIKKAKEEFEAQCKEEKKRIKREAKENMKKLISQRDIPELEELVSQTEHKYEIQGKTVSILELDVNKLRQSDSWIGENRPSYENCISDDGKSDDDDDDYEESTRVPGMELKMKPKSVKNENDKLHLSKKELSRVVQKETLKKMKKNKVFQRKQKMQRTKNKKLAMKDKIKKDRAGKPTKGKKKNRKFSHNKE